MAVIILAPHHKVSPLSGKLALEYLSTSEMG